MTTRALVTSWGRLETHPHYVFPLHDRNHVSEVLIHHHPGLAHGMGRSYGDVCLNPGGVIWNTTGLDRFIRFDDESGRLVCEAGVLLGDIQQEFIPRGWILPVTPGTRFVTVGGAIANDVHGKSHHVMGSFGDHVHWIRLLRTQGELIECGPTLRPEWFAATVGGIGLTGVILEAEIQLLRAPGAWLETEIVPYNDLDEFFRLSDDSETGWEHSVSWIDCVSAGGSRGLFMRGNPTDVRVSIEPKGRNLKIPFTPPMSIVNRPTLRLFNKAYFALKKGQSRRNIVHYAAFFYPLDNLLEWNRLYGNRGFFQYQAVVPREAGKDPIKTLLREVGSSGNGSFLSVLKTFGNRQPVGMMSFPRPGVTLALDFPNNGTSTIELFKRLDAIVREAGGRIYLAKDAGMARNVFEAGYPRLNQFQKFRDPGISSALSRRLMGS